MILLDNVTQRANIRHAMETTVHARITERMKRQLEKLAEQENRTVSNYLRTLIERTVKESKSEKINSSLQSAG